jgi:hypothetical protein
MENRSGQYPLTPLFGNHDYHSQRRRISGALVVGHFLLGLDVLRLGERPLARLDAKESAPFDAASHFVIVLGLVQGR